MAITQEIDLNLIPSSAPVIVHLNQYDEGKGRIIAHLYNGSSPYVPGVNATVKVQGTKPDKHAFQYWCDIDGSTVTVDVNVQMTAVAGLVPTQLIVNETSGITGSFAFQLDVQASTLPSNIDVSETDLPILTEEAQEAARRAVQAAASAEESAEEAAAWSSNPPYIGENLHWFVYDTETEQFIDSGVVAEGQDGEPGNKWYKGTVISGESSTPTVFPSSGIALAYHNDFYLNATEGSIYHCETPGDASTATWVYDFRLSGGGGGVTNYNDLTNKPKIGGVELTGNKTIADLGGVQSFNGRSGSILPVAGDYNSSQIILSSIMHIGGGTQDDVQEALEALDSKDAGGSTITVTTAEVTLRGKNVTLSDGVNTWTKQFDNSGNAIFTSIMSTGALSVTASDGTETASGTINAPYFGNYTCPIAFFEAVVTVYGGTGMLGGCPVVAKKDGVVVASGVLSNIFGQPSEYVFHLNQPGTYTFEVTNDWRTFSSDPATYSASGTYNTTVNGFETDVVVYTSSTEFKGKDVTVTCAGVPTSTIRLDASLGSAVYKALMPGTYTFSLTYQGTVYTTSAVVSVTDTQISAPPLALWTATLAITTSSSSLYGKTITIKKGSTVVGTTAFSAQGSASYTVHETGTYTCECEGYSGSATVSAETTYNVTITAGLDLSSWITAGSTTDYPLNPSSYADFSALEADEAAVRQLMLVHDAVDYLATATAGDSLMQSVINSDVCAKWINLSDYALDTLSANSDIASEMDTADKYGYGEWIVTDSTTTPVTWGPLGNVPIMTANNAPYGTAFADTEYSSAQGAFAVFNGNTSVNWSSTSGALPHYVGYTSVNPICVKKVSAILDGLRTKAYQFEASNDGFVTKTVLYTGTNSDQGRSVPIEFDVENDNYFISHRILITESWEGTGNKYSSMVSLQFYGRELTPLVPTMTGNTTPKGEVIYSTQYSSDIHAAWHVFVSGTSSSWSPAASDSYGNAYIGYHAIAKCKALMAYVDSKVGTNRLTKYKIQASNDKFATTPVDVSSVIDNDVAKYIDLSSSTGYDDYRILLTQGGGNIDLATVYNIQFYGMDYSEKEFATGSTRKTIYDHGVELVAVESVGNNANNYAQKRSQDIYVHKQDSASGAAVMTSNAIDLSSESYSILGTVIGRELNQYEFGLRSQKTYGENNNISTKAPYGYIISRIQMLDISSVQQSAYPYVGMYQKSAAAEMYMTVDEIWLE